MPVLLAAPLRIAVACDMHDAWYGGMQLAKPALAYRCDAFANVRHMLLLTAAD